MATGKKNTRQKTDDRALDALVEDAAFLSNQLEEAKTVEGSQLGRIPSKPENELGVRVLEAREAKRMTQGELADLTKSLDPDQKGISRAVISLYEAGTNRPSPREIRLLCEALRVTPNFLIYGDEEPFHPLRDADRLAGASARSDPEGYAWMAYVFATLHHNHFDALMSLALDLQRGWNKKFDQGLQDEANKQLLDRADALRQRLKKRESSK